MVHCYRDAWCALLVLDPTGAWQQVFRELKDDNNCGPGCEADELSEKRYEPSWIWLLPQNVTASSADPKSDDEHPRVEWAKAMARTER